MCCTYFSTHQIFITFLLPSHIKLQYFCVKWWELRRQFYNALPNFLILISMVRYRAIVHPLKPAVSRGTLKKLSACVYVLAVVFVIPYVLVLRYDTTSGCHEQWPMESLNIAYTLSLTAVQFLIPATVLSVIYFKICKKLAVRNNWFHRLNVRSKIPQKNPRENTWFQSTKLRSTKAFVVSFTIVICFIISACPTHVAWAVFAVSSSKEIVSHHGWFDALYLFGTTVIHFYVYGVFDSKVFFSLQAQPKSRIMTN